MPWGVEVLFVGTLVLAIYIHRRSLVNRGTQKEGRPITSGRLFQA